jgi:hypothetical protein
MTYDESMARSIIDCIILRLPSQELELEGGFLSASPCELNKYNNGY